MPDYRPNISTAQVMVGMMISLCLALLLTNISASGPRFDNRDEVIHNQLAILHGTPYTIRGVPMEYPQFQSRVLFPLLLEGASELDFLELRQWYIVLRILTAFSAFAMCYLTCMSLTRSDVFTTCLGMGLLAYGLVFTFNHPWEHPTDFVDVFFFCLFFAFVVQRKRTALTVAVLLGTLNHQTAAFAGIVWLVVYGVKRDKTIDGGEIFFAVLLMAASYALSTFVRLVLGYGYSVAYVFNGYLTIVHLIDFLKHPNPYGWPVMLIVMHIPLAVWLLSNRQGMQGLELRIFVSALCIVAISSPIAFWSEIRSVFLAPYVILTLLAVSLHAKAACKRLRQDPV